MKDGLDPTRDTRITPSTPRRSIQKERASPLWALYGIIGSLLLALVILVILFGIYLFRPINIDVHPPPVVVNPSPPRPSENRTLLAYSNGQLRAAYRLQSMLNHSVGPCDDFFEYVCGRALSENAIPSHTNSYNAFELQEKIDKQVDRLLRSPEPSSSKSIEKVKIFYNSCLDQNKYSNLAVQEALEKIRSVGDFPLLGWKSPGGNNFSWPEYMLSLAKKEVSPAVFSLAVSVDPKNVSRKLLFFSGVGGAPLKRVYWTNETNFGNVIEAYKRRTKKIVELFIEDTKLPPNPQLDTEFDELFTFYRRLINIGTEHQGKGTKESLRSDWGRPSKREMMNYGAESSEEQFPSLVSRFEDKTGLNLLVLMTTLAPELAHPFLSDENLLVVVSPRLEDMLTTLIKETSPNTWRNFYQMRILESYLDHFPGKYGDVLQEFNEVCYGIKEKSAKWRGCLRKASGITEAYNAIYLRKHSDKETKKQMEEMAENVRESFSQIIQETDWMDAETKKNAFVKLKALIPKIAYNEIAFDDTKLDEEYKDLDIDRKMSFLNMTQEYKRWGSIKSWEETLKPPNRHDFSVSAPEVNAYYNGGDNSILFPYAILHEPFFDRELPQSLNYGGIGAVFGHEITHGFDSNGRHWDEIGNRRNWWSNSSNRNFEERAKEMVEQYNNFEMKEVGMRVDGELTLGENIADNGGIKESFRAYKTYLERNGREAPIPGFDYTNEQLFYIGYGYSWCTKMTPEQLRLILLTNEHAPEKARVNVVLQNQQEFAEAFKCPSGSPMNPTKKVVVW